MLLKVGRGRRFAKHCLGARIPRAGIAGSHLLRAIPLCVFSLVVCTSACTGEVDRTSDQDILAPLLSGTRVVFHFPAQMQPDTVAEREILRALAAQDTFPAQGEARLPAVMHIVLTESSDPGRVAAAIVESNTIRVQYAGVYLWSHQNLRTILRHELAHFILNSAVRRRLVPVWFSEGYAEWASGLLNCFRYEKLPSAVLHNKATIHTTFQLDRIETAFGGKLSYELYRTTLDFLNARLGAIGIERLVRETADHGFSEAMLTVAGLTLKEFERAWIDFLGREFGSLPGGTTGRCGAGS